MSLKPIFSLAGLAGSIMGIAGVGGSSEKSSLTPSPDFHSNQPVDEILPYSWKLQPIDSVEVAYSCKGEENSREVSSGTFKVKVKEGGLKDIKGEKLIIGEKVGLGIDYEFKLDKGWDSFKLKRLGDRGKAYMTVSNSWWGGLRIVLKEEKSSVAQSSDINLNCQIESGKGIRELHKNSYEVFRGWVNLDKSKEAVTLKDWRGSVKLSLYNCPFKRKEGINTCDLKLSDSSGRKWNNSFSSKANFEFSPAKI